MVAPCLRWPGSKTLLAAEVIALLGPHAAYIEPYFGSGAVLLRKPRSKTEWVNDLDGEVVNFYNILRNRTDEFIQKCMLTPCAEEEWRNAKEQADEVDDLERARRFFTRICQSHGASVNGGWIPSTGSSTLGSRWRRNLDRLGPVAERLQGVQVSCRDALQVLESSTRTESAAIYLDPPYLEATVTKSDHYKQRDGLSEDHHRQMLELATSAVGTVVISGYTHPLYEEELGDWERVVVHTVHSGNPQSTEADWAKEEVLWTNRKDLTLF